MDEARNEIPRCFVFVFVFIGNSRYKILDWVLMYGACWTSRFRVFVGNGGIHLGRGRKGLDLINLDLIL